MGIAIFFVLTLIAAGIIVYPLLPGQRVRHASAGSQSAPIVTNRDIELAVRDLRQARAHSDASLHGQSCPTCREAYQPGDSFCVRCGGALPSVRQGLPATASGPVCPSCGAAIREGDKFCAKCGQRTAVREVA